MSFRRALSDAPTAWCNAAGLALPMRQVGIVDPGAAGALERATDQY